MKQIARVIQFFTDKLKSYIVTGLFVVLVPSFALGQDFPQDRKNENKITEEVVPNEPTEKVVPVVPKTAPPPTAAGIPYGTIFQLQKPIACNDTPVIQNFLENMNGMIPITMGTSKNPMGVITSLVQVYANPINDAFAIVEHFVIKKSCIIFQGHDFDIILPAGKLGPKGQNPDRQAFN